MREAGKIVALTLQELRARVAPGISTQELDRIAEALIHKMGGKPSFKGYHGYPATICTSINEEIVHGIPDARRIAEGDIVSLDCGAIWEGYQADATVTVSVGTIGPDVERLLQMTEAALMAGIAEARAGNRLGDISHAVEQVALAAGLAVVREYGGHGIGREMHELPRIPNWGPAGRGLKLKAGMTMALEPMLTLGGYETRQLANNWTVVTADGSLSAHFEHTIAVTENGAEILTRI